MSRGASTYQSYAFHGMSAGALAVPDTNLTFVVKESFVSTSDVLPMYFAQLLQSHSVHQLPLLPFRAFSDVSLRSLKIRGTRYAT